MERISRPTLPVAPTTATLKAMSLILILNRLPRFRVHRLCGFTPPPAGRELFCTRTKWLAMERVAKVKAALLAALDEPPPLEALAQLAGVNPHHLSRTFTQVEGITQIGRAHA